MNKSDQAKHMYIDTVNVIIDGTQTETVFITGSGMYNPNSVKRDSKDMYRKSYPNSKIIAVILQHEEVTLDEYQARLGQNPPWLGNIEK